MKALDARGLRVEPFGLLAQRPGEGQRQFRGQNIRLALIGAVGHGQDAIAAEPETNMPARHKNAPSCDEAPCRPIFAIVSEHYMSTVTVSRIFSYHACIHSGALHGPWLAT